MNKIYHTQVYSTGYDDSPEDQLYGHTDEFLAPHKFFGERLTSTRDRNRNNAGNDNLMEIFRLHYINWVIVMNFNCLI